LSRFFILGVRVIATMPESRIYKGKPLYGWRF
jgi:hypothetical protein